MAHAPDFVPALIVFGTDDTGRPHASVFDQADADKAKAAAGLMGMYSLPVRPAEHTDIVGQLPPGRVFDSGKAFVPFVKGELYDRISALGEAAGVLVPVGAVDGRGEAETPPAAAPESSSEDANAEPSGPANAPDPWADIKVGSLVLCQDAEAEGYFEARVVKEKGKGIFTLKFRDYPDEPTVDRQIKQMALLHPSAAHPKR